MRPLLCRWWLIVCLLPFTTQAAPRYPALALTLLHINDHHSQLEGFSAVELPLAGEATRVELGGFPRLTTFFRQRENQPHALKLHAGDATTGSLYYTLFKGAADARLMNTVCFDAFELGNHEFDGGDATLANFLDELAAASCQTPVLAANVTPAIGTPLQPSTRQGAIKPYVIKHVDGVAVAIIGLEVKGKTEQSSRPLPSTRFADETLTAQHTIDRLRQQGIRHIVLLTHLGYQADLQLAAQLREVDVIIGGDSHTLLGAFNDLGLASSGPYPTRLKNRDGDTVCVAQAWEYTKAVGELHISFDRQGRVAQCQGQARLVLGERFQRRNAAGQWEALDEAANAALRAQLATDPRLAILPADPQAEQQLQAFRERIAAAQAQHLGQAPEPLCLVRVPGESTNRSGGIPGCESANRLARGSDAAQVVAAAYLAADARADFALQNAGGVRTPIPAGDLSMNTLFGVLPFDNTLVELELTGAEIHAMLEEAVANWRDAQRSDGAHPYAAGLRWQLDLSRPAGQRFSALQIHNRHNGAWQAVDPAQRYVMITSDYVASGKDGYALLARIGQEPARAARNTYLLYTQTFADYVSRQGTVLRPPRSEYAHQQVIGSDGQPLADQ